jgi:DNA-binding IclR family transcriptional regulator
VPGQFGRGRRTLSLTSLSARAGLPKSTTFRLARKLTELGALERAEYGEYMVGLRLLEVASLAPRGHGLRATALPYLEDLHHATGQHVLLAVRDGTAAVLVERLSARGAMRIMYRVGGRIPLHSTGVGLVLLAHAPPPVQEEVLAGPLPLAPGSAEGAARELRVTLAAIRHDGVAVLSRRHPDPEPVTTVACPVYGPGRGAAGGTSRGAAGGTSRGAAGGTSRGAAGRAGREVVAALSVVTRSEDVEPGVLAPAVIAVARAVSRAVAAG